MTRPTSVRSRVGRLETARVRGGGGAASACGVCGGGGYAGLYVQTGEGSEPEQVGITRCPGCGRVRVGAVVLLPGGEHWAGVGEDGEGT